MVELTGRRLTPSSVSSINSDGSIHAVSSWLSFRRPCLSRNVPVSPKLPNFLIYQGLQIPFLSFSICRTTWCPLRNCWHCHLRLLSLSGGLFYSSQLINFWFHWLLSVDFLLSMSSVEQITAHKILQPFLQGLGICQWFLHL